MGATVAQRFTPTNAKNASITVACKLLLNTGFPSSISTGRKNSKKGLLVFVELVYDKRNVAGLPGANEIILTELTKRVHRIFPDAAVRVKPMQANGLNSDASKSDREKLNRMLEEMFEEADMWLVQE